MPSTRDHWHALARLGPGLGLLTLLLVSHACTEDNLTEAGGNAPDAAADAPDADQDRVESPSSCLYDEASDAVERARAAANLMPCLRNDDCIHTSELPTCYAGCPV
ncbi:MAG TPA: hypothetical protein VMF89_07210, partial [Polyangiales bacterium]|nr:hypothetical protein [Polyangiales bacterium]